MLSAIVTSNYVLAQSIQRGLLNSNLNTLVYKTDFSVVDHYDFIYHDGFFVHLIEPTEQHLNFCLHLNNLASGKTMFVLIESGDVEILNAFKDSLSAPIFISPFAYRNIASIYQNMMSFDLDHTRTHVVQGLNLKLDFSTRHLHVNDEFSIPLGTKEFFIMKFLFTHRYKIITNVDLFEFVWGKNLLGATDTVDVYMSKLRRKLKQYLKFDPIRTIFCVGYMFE